VAIEWAPALAEAWVEFSGDGSVWVTLDGPIAGGGWSGEVPEGAEELGFLRVRSGGPGGPGAWQLR
jgi:hypothetical protein